MGKGLDEVAGHLAKRVIDHIFDEAEKDANDRREWAERAAQRGERHNAAQRKAEEKADREFDQIVGRHRGFALTAEHDALDLLAGTDASELERIMASMLSTTC